MRMTHTVARGAALLLVLCGAARAAEIQATSPATSAPSRDRAAEDARLLRLDGRVEQVTPTSLTVRGPEGTGIAFRVSDQTVVLDAQVAKNVADLRVGDRVEVRYFADANGGNAAQIITMQPRGR